MGWPADLCNMLLWSDHCAVGDKLIIGLTALFLLLHVPVCGEGGRGGGRKGGREGGREEGREGVPVCGVLQYEWSGLLQQGCRAVGVRGQQL